MHEIFKTHGSVLLIDFTGLNVADATELRRKVADSGSGYQVVKNTLAMRAAEETPLAELTEHFQGPTAIAFHKDNPIELAKILRDFLKERPDMAFKAGVVDQSVVSAEQVQALADMPSREELLSKLLFLLQTPLRNLGAVLRAPLRDLAMVLAQIPKKED